MYDFHENKSRYFEIQRWVTAQYIIPFLELPANTSLRVLEVGCGEAGVLKAFLDQGHSGMGIELSSTRVEMANAFLSDEVKQGKVEIVNANIYDIDPMSDRKFQFDLIVLKDVIEHIPDQAKFMAKLKQFLKPGGKVFFAYPPWWMPFGGHQQICKSKLLSKLPWFHLLPMSLYVAFLRMMGEGEPTIKELREIKETGIISEKIHSIIRNLDYRVIKETFWLINPIYVRKFNFKPLKALLAIPYLRNIYCTAHYISFGLK
ncbi:MAG TPA: class I SAM-dependent methyltransferase [Saprospiraceae bacterium]|jgi:2-polyprenyl-3-methyl-5-hydroxy-6-metoxy-1,4-benzoquinol methylase|nr:class I SAM-dependent methyltransferase [Saprospiraceae bacterium]HRG21771.1 class I SAM-dependent methyltransferase [Saprospiraceae bacterium]